jgi:hypothetical protein
MGFEIKALHLLGLESLALLNIVLRAKDKMEITQIAVL